LSRVPRRRTSTAVMHTSSCRCSMRRSLI
jgi:hypothetical protein